jgi:hypothetical protein
MKEVITLTEKRFFEWHEDDVSVTLRNKGGSYGGVPKCSSSRAVGLDLYNGMITGGVSMSLTSKRVDPHHIPCVLVTDSGGGSRTPMQGYRVRFSPHRNYGTSCNDINEWKNRYT